MFLPLDRVDCTPSALSHVIIVDGIFDNIIQCHYKAALIHVGQLTMRPSSSPSNFFSRTASTSCLRNYTTMVVSLGFRVQSVRLDNDFAFHSIDFIAACDDSHIAR
jgi:hypothetical protein